MDPLPGCAQYPSSLRLAQELCDGKRQSFRAPWRCIWSDGCLYEMKAHIWVAESEDVNAAHSGRGEPETPSKLIISVMRDDCTLVEDVQS